MGLWDCGCGLCGVGSGVLGIVLRIGARRGAMYYFSSARDEDDGLERGVVPPVDAVAQHEVLAECNIHKLVSDSVAVHTSVYDSKKVIQVLDTILLREAARHVVCRKSKSSKLSHVN